MCLIVIKDGTESPEPNILENAAYSNSDGLGILWLDNWEIEKVRSEDWEILLKNPGRDYIAHFRYATVGEVSIKNCHPFRINEDCYLFQNGTNGNLGNSKMTDTEHMARILRDIPPKYWRDVLEVTDSRYVTVDIGNRSYAIHNKSKWKKDKSNNLYSTWFSTYKRKSYYSGADYDAYNSANAGRWTGMWDIDRDDTEETNDLQNFKLGDYVAVYGTLKEGGSNERYLQNAVFRYYGVTSDKYPMILMKYPMLLDKPGIGKHIDVEVYRIWNTQLIKKLDYIEQGYVRKKTLVTVEDDDGSIKEVVCWMYFIVNPEHYEKWCTEEYMHSTYNV